MSSFCRSRRFAYISEQSNTPVLKLVGVPIGVRRRNPRSNVSQRPRDREDCKLTELGEALAQEWERIAAAGTRLHEAYTAGMSRLSCRFCVLSSRADLVCSARLNPDLADRYAEVERRIGHRFRTDLHADRGCQYTSAQLAGFAHRHNLARSVGSTGACWDNAAAESCWATLKVEFYDQIYGPAARPPSSLSATGSSGSTTGADATQPSV